MNSTSSPNQTTESKNATFNNTVTATTTTTTRSPARRMRTTDEILNQQQFTSMAGMLMSYVPERKSALTDSMTSFAKEFTSASEYRNTMRKHLRSSVSPQKRYTQPVTSAQEYGWDFASGKRSVANYARRSCPITRYSEEVLACIAPDGSSFLRTK